MNDDVNMMVSPVCTKDGKSYAFVSFEDGEKTAEGKIPDCNIIANKGFSADEVQQLETYMKRELTNLKKMAANINPMDALLK